MEIPLGQDEQISEQFLCMICGNLVIPGFTLGADGIKKSSIKIPQCQTCNGLACYGCWRVHMRKDTVSCPNC